MSLICFFIVFTNDSELSRSTAVLLILSLRTESKI